MALYEIKGLSFSYPGRNKPALSGIDFSLEQGELVTLCGATGSGKTTLLRQLKPLLAPHGNLIGDILYDNAPLKELGQMRAAAEIGYVSQHPDNQIVTDRVWHELAFGLENLGFDERTIRLRTSETAAYFGLEKLFLRDVSTLSGGQKQLLNLAAVMALQPKVLLLDEPTAQLDPIAAASFIDALRRVNRELGVSVLISEHKSQEAFENADRVVYLRDGQIFAQGNPRDVASRLSESGYRDAVPAAAYIFNEKTPLPLSVAEGRAYFSGISVCDNIYPSAPQKKAKEDCSVVIKNLRFAYDRRGEDVLRGLSFSAPRGKISAILGGNGAGKSTLLALIAGILKPQGGSIRRNGSTALLPQEPRCLFLKNTVQAELEDMLRIHGKISDNTSRAIEKLELNSLMKNHPFDLSGGEMQRLALAKVLIAEPEILLLDEPTKGLDFMLKRRLANILRRLADEGKTIIMASHDLDFCAEYGDFCALCFRGELVAEGEPHAFFGGNNFYTTAANRIARDAAPFAITREEVREIWKSLCV
ncbi:MAG: ATP-binding cassette domain-containing protein [Clostridium sp.]|nr:ATP-binding cassette domain-containing protein [Clostridium sp.]